MVPVTARLEGRDLGSGVADVRRCARAGRLPVGYSYAIGGLYESQQASFRSLVLVLGDRRAARVRRAGRAVPAVHAGARDPVGRAAVARRRVRLLLLVTGTPLNVSSFMGLILLVGLIVKNGIILVDYADILVARGPDAERGAGARRAPSGCGRS